MINGVRASSIRIESTSSTTAKYGGALDALLQRGRHVVAQVVEAELVVGRVGDVGGVGHPALVGTHLRGDHADGEPEELVHAAHPLGVVLGEVVVDRDDVDALAGQPVEVGRQRGDEGLALTGLHLRDVAEVQGGTAHDLHVEVSLAEHALGGLAHGGERLGHDRVELLAVRDPLLELDRHPLQLFVRHGDEVVLDGVDRLGDRFELAQDLALADAQDLVDERHAGYSLGWRRLEDVVVLGVGVCQNPSTIVTVGPAREFRTGRSGSGPYGAAQDHRRRRTPGAVREAEPVDLGDREAGLLDGAGRVAPEVATRRRAGARPSRRAHPAAGARTPARGLRRARGSAARHRAAAPGAPRRERSPGRRPSRAPGRRPPRRPHRRPPGGRRRRRRAARRVRRRGRRRARAGAVRAPRRRPGSPCPGSGRSWPRLRRRPRPRCPTGRTAAVASGRRHPLGPATARSAGGRAGRRAGG